MRFPFAIGLVAAMLLAVGEGLVEVRLDDGGAAGTGQKIPFVKPIHLGGERGD